MLQALEEACIFKRVAFGAIPEDMAACGLSTDVCYTFVSQVVQPPICSASFSQMTNHTLQVVQNLANDLLLSSERQDFEDHRRKVGFRLLRTIRMSMLRNVFQDAYAVAHIADLRLICFKKLDVS